MAFTGDTFFPLGLPPYTGPLKAEFQNLADGLTELKSSTSSAGFTLHRGSTSRPPYQTGVDGDWYLNTADGSWYDQVRLNVWTISLWGDRPTRRGRDHSTAL